MQLIRSPVAFFEKIIALFQMKKSQNDTEKAKIPIFFQFSKILYIFPNIFNGL